MSTIGTKERSPKTERPGRLRTARDFRLLTHSEAIDLARYLGLPVPLQRREYSLAEIYNPEELNVRKMLATTSDSMSRIDKRTGEFARIQLPRRG